MILKTGTTLIELLLAIAIALLVIAIVFSMYHTATRVIESQDARQEGPISAAHALDLMIRDLHCAYMPDESRACGFSLGQPDAGNSDEVQMRFCTATVPLEEDMRWFEFEHVLYRFQPGSDRNGVLSREHTMLAGPGSEGAETTNILARQVERLKIEAFDGQTWMREWTEDGLPRGVRLTLESEGRIYSAQAFIPAANIISSTVIRAATVR